MVEGGQVEHWKRRRCCPERHAAFLVSGEKQAHKQNLVSWSPLRGGGVSQPGGQGSSAYVLSSEPKEQKLFRLSTRPKG